MGRAHQQTTSSVVLSDIPLIQEVIQAVTALGLFALLCRCRHISGIVILDRSTGSFERLCFGFPALLAMRLWRSTD